MDFHVLTLFPEMVENTVQTSITGRAVKNGKIALHTVNIRDFADNKHSRVDDYPYGGGAGMVIQAEPVYQAYQSVKKRTSKPDVFISLLRERFLTRLWQRSLPWKRSWFFSVGIMRELTREF